LLCGFCFCRGRCVRHRNGCGIWGFSGCGLGDRRTSTEQTGTEQTGTEQAGTYKNSTVKKQLSQLLNYLHG